MNKRLRVYYKYDCTKLDMLAYTSLMFAFSGCVVLALGLI